MNIDDIDEIDEIDGIDDVDEVDEIDREGERKREREGETQSLNHLSFHQRVRSATHHHNNSPLLRFPIVETSITALCGNYYWYTRQTKTHKLCVYIYKMYIFTYFVRLGGPWSEGDGEI